MALSHSETVMSKGEKDEEGGINKQTLTLQLKISPPASVLTKLCVCVCTGTLQADGSSCTEQK